MTRYKCANCGYVFDRNMQSWNSLYECPKCKSNALDRINILDEQVKY